MRKKIGEIVVPVFEVDEYPKNINDSTQAVFWKKDAPDTDWPIIIFPKWEMEIEDEESGMKRCVFDAHWFKRTFEPEKSEVQATIRFEGLSEVVKNRLTDIIGDATIEDILKLRSEGLI